MKLRTRVLIWLLPALLPLVFFFYLQYQKQLAQLVDHTQSVMDITVDNGAHELNGYLRLQQTSFDLLRDTFSSQVAGSLDSLQEHNSAIASMLLNNPGFSMLLATDLEGEIVYSLATTALQNRNYFHRSLAGKQAFDEGERESLLTLFKGWQKQLPGAKKEVNVLLEKLSDMDAQGEKYSAHRREVQNKLSFYQNYIRRPGHSIYFGGDVLLPISGLPSRINTFIFTAPLVMDSGEHSGFMLAILDWGVVESMVRATKLKLADSGLGAFEVALMDAAQKRVLTYSHHPEKLLEAKKSRELNGDNAVKNFLLSQWSVEDAASLDSETLRHSYTLSDGRFIGADSVETPESNFCLIAVCELGSVLANTGQLQEETLVSILVGVMVLIAAAVVLISKIIAPVTELSRAMLGFGRGEYSRRVSVSRVDELGELSRVFNSMAASIEDVRAKLAQNAKQLKTAKEHAEAASRAKDKFLANMSHDYAPRLTASSSSPTS